MKQLITFILLIILTLGSFYFDTVFEDGSTWRFLLFIATVIKFLLIYLFFMGMSHSHRAWKSLGVGFVIFLLVGVGILIL